MRAGVNRVAAVVAALICVLAAAAPASAQRTVPPAFFGVNWDGAVAFGAPADVQDRQFGQMAAAGAESVRPAFSWSDAQPDQNGPISFDSTDRIVAMASRHGISVLPIVIGAPAWARQAPGSDFSPPVSAYAYGRWLTALVGRYGPSGSFWDEHPELARMPIRSWQIWNEPHLPFQWTVPSGTDWATGYAHLLRVSYKTLKAADPGSTVVLAGLTNSSPGFLKQLYKAGIHGYFDVAAIHPYTLQPRGVLTLSRRFRAVMAQYHDASKRLWVTELGLPASKGRVHSSNYLQTTDSGMAKFLTDSYALLVRSRRTLHLARVYWYTWASEYSGDIFRFTGLLRYASGDSASTEPAYGAYVASARRYEGCTKTGSGACR